MVRLKDLLLEKKLRVFDFDDTLVKSNSKVYVTNKGKKKTLTPGQFAIYKKKSGDEFDFSDFDKVIEPKQIKAMFKVFKNIYKVMPSEVITVDLQSSKFSASKSKYWNIENFLDNKPFIIDEFLNIFLP